MTTWHTVTHLSDHLSLTNEGFLLAKDIVIARTGSQLYRHNELPELEPNGDGWLTVDRDPDEVFHPDTIASFNGKPITNDHPSDMVTPDNWGDLAIGTVQNVRRGSGPNNDVLIADLLFTSAKGIRLVKQGKRALSCGYDSGYEQKAPGRARQTKIVGNHVALVDEGRCGARCMVIDGKPIINDTPPPLRAKTLVTFWYDRMPILRIEDKDFKEENVKRAPKGKSEGGQFTANGGGGGESKGKTEGHVGTKKVDGKLVAANGQPLPKHIQDLKIPPPWTDVTYHPDPGVSLQVVGKDARGRRQALYSETHNSQASQDKYDRVKLLERSFNTIRKKNEAERAKGNDAADALALIMHTGMRPGGEADTGAANESYGATNLEGRHIIETPTGMKLKFVPGKKHGQEIEMPIDDPEIQDMLRQRKQKAGPNGRLFPVTGKQVLRHVKKLSPNFVTKDFRTHIGTQEAIKAVGRTPSPKTPDEYKRAVKHVADQVAAKLGNTPAIALSSYISPTVFAHWQHAAGQTQDAMPEMDADGDELGLPDAHWGYVGKRRPFGGLADADDSEDDDADPTECPPDVIEMLGFDPFAEDGWDELVDPFADDDEDDDEDGGLDEDPD